MATQPQQVPTVSFAKDGLKAGQKIGSTTIVAIHKTNLTKPIHLRVK